MSTLSFWFFSSLKYSRNDTVKYNSSGMTSISAKPVTSILRGSREFMVLEFWAEAGMRELIPANKAIAATANRFMAI